MKPLLTSLALLGLACGVNTSAWSVPGPRHNGVATYYDATGAGACSFEAGGDLQVAAADTQDFAGSLACGACVSIQGPKGSTTVRIVDLCPDCQANQLDLSQSAFAKIAEPSAGRVNVTWQPVPCNVQGNVEYVYKDGSSPYWTAIQVRNHRVPIASLEWQHGSTWQSVPRESYNYFVISAGAGSGPVSVRITGTTGESLEDTLPAVEPSTTHAGRAQFH